MLRRAEPKDRTSGRVGVLFMQSQTWFGSDSMIHSLIMTELDRGRFDVHAAPNRGTGREPSASLAALRTLPDVRIRPTSFGPSINFRSWRDRIRDTASSGPRAIFSLVGLVRYARKNDIKIVHGTEKPRDAFYGYLVARGSGAKSIVHLHVGVREDSWMLPLTRFAMRRADGILAVSDFIRGTAIRKGYRPERCYAVVNAIDASLWDPSIDGTSIRREFGIGPETVVLSIISRMYSWKGHTELLKALAKVTPEYDDYRLLIVGEDDVRAHPGHGSYTAELRELVAELDLDEHVTFTGFRDDVSTILAATDIYTMPSYEEPCAVAFLEALAMAVPVVAYDSGGTAQMVDHEQSGLLSMPYDIDQLATNLLRLMRDGPLRKTMGRHGRRRVIKHYTPRRLAADVERVYDHVLSPREHPHPNEGG